MVLGGNTTANDTSLKYEIIDSFGGEDVAVGGAKCKTCHGKGWRGREHRACEACHCTESGTHGCGYETHPGPLRGIWDAGVSHIWSALAVGLTFEKQQEEEESE